jgi:hypothetical protein
MFRVFRISVARHVARRGNLPFRTRRGRKFRNGRREDPRTNGTGSVKGKPTFERKCVVASSGARILSYPDDSSVRSLLLSLLLGGFSLGDRPPHAPAINARGWAGGSKVADQPVLFDCTWCSSIGRCIGYDRGVLSIFVSNAPLPRDFRPALAHVHREF